MVAGAFFNDFTKGIAEGIGNLFNNAGIGGRSIDGNESGGGGGGNLISDLITRVLDPDNSNNSGGSGGGGLGDTIKNVILDNLTVENLNTFKGLLRGYWNDHKGHDEAEVRKDLDIIRKQLGNEGMAGRLAKTIECIEDDISDDLCDIGMRNNLPEYDNDDFNENLVRNANDVYEATTNIIQTTSKLLESTNAVEKSSQMMGETVNEVNQASESFAFDAKAPNFILMLLCAFFVLAIVHMVLKRRL